MTLFLAAGDPLSHVLPHPLFNIGGLTITNQMFMALVAALLMLLCFPLIFARAAADAPTGARNLFESILEYLRIEVIRPALKEHTDRFVPFLWTLFFFILFCNLLGQIPVGEIFTVLQGGKHESHFGGTATGNIATTAALAIVTFLFIHLSGIWQVARSLIDGTYGHHDHHEEHSSDGTSSHPAAHDLEHHRGDALAADIPGNLNALGDPTGHYEDDEHKRHQHDGIRQGDAQHHGHHEGMNPVMAILACVPLYFWNFAPHPFKPGPGGNPIMWVVDVLMWAFLLVLELIGALIKPFALTVRLFANMIAGHIVLAVLVSLIPIGAGILVQLGIGAPVTILSLLIRLLEVLVAFLQAYIFTFLATLFIASAVAPEH